jgi:F0F1-type ATP synthase membrane subunit b/b'
MSPQMQALRKASKALAKSVPSLTEPDKSKAQDAIDDLEDQMDDLAVAEFDKVTEAVQHFVEEMEDVLDSVNAHASQQIKAEVNSALAELKEHTADA